MQRSSEVSGKLVEVCFGVGKGEVKFCSHWIKEHSAAEQLQHDGAAALSVGGEPVSVAAHRPVEERRLRQRAIAQHLRRHIRLAKRLAKRSSQLPAKRV